MKNPFVGLRPFSSNDQDIFFGRAKEISVLRDLVLTLPVLIVYAPSGTGKSSLINAGLIPEIRKIPSMVDITIADPRIEPTKVVRDVLSARGWVPDDNEEEGLSLANLLEMHYKNTDRRVVLVLDQFEERIKQRFELDSLYREIAKLANTRSEAATIVISIREDYLAGLDRLMRRVTGLLDAGYRVPPLSRVALTEAVMQPLSVVGADSITAEPELVDRVLTDLEQQRQAADPDARHIEPGYFQIVWHRLWAADIEDASGSTLTLATYLGEGGVPVILKSFVMRILGHLLPFEAALLQATLRYLVLPTGAKVPLTIDDLVGLLRSADVSFGFDVLFFPQERKYTSIGPLYDFDTNTVSQPGSDRMIVPEATRVFDSLFEELTRTDAPLFRRVWRGTRQEFELVHDLLGNILNEWSKEYSARQNELLKEFQYSGTVTQGDHISYAGIVQLLKEISEDATAGKWGEIGVQQVSDNLHRALVEFNARRWRTEQFKEIERLIASIRSMFIKEAFENPDRESRRVLQDISWQITLAQILQRRVIGSSYQWRTGIAATVFGTAASASSLLITVWASTFLSFLPLISYRILTFATVGVGLAILYGGTYISNLSGDGLWVDWHSLAGALWPMEGIESGRLASGLYERLGFLSIFVWWPLFFATFATLDYIGAAIFDFFGWSPTAGFNLAAVIVAIPLLVAYITSADL